MMVESGGDQKFVSGASSSPREVLNSASRHQPTNPSLSNVLQNAGYEFGIASA